MGFVQKLSKEEDFFRLFQEIADLIVQGANEFKTMLENDTQVERYARSIKDIEHRADQVTHQTIELLHKTFITPLEREDIHTLISGMDDILDFIDAAAQRVFMFDIGKPRPAAFKLIDTCIASAALIRKAVAGIQNSKNAKETIAICHEIHRYENEADQILRAAVADLFKNEPDTRQLIKLKEVYELLETVTDRCEDVANVIEGIVLDHA